MSRMPPSAAGMMMPGSNPYGPSGPPPPSLAGTPFSAPSGAGGMSGPLGGRMSSMYPTSVGGMSGSTTGSSGGGGVAVGGASHPQHPHPPPPGMGPGGTPSSKPSSVLNTVQLQQLSAQLKAYRLLARNVSPPEALISIVHGRKPTAAMLAGLSKQPQHHHPSSPSSSSLNVPPTQGDTQKGNSASEGGSGGNISLYPLSPNVSQAGSPAANTSQAPPVRSTSSLAQSLSTSVSGGAPNVTISSSGELPLSVKQAMSAAQTR